MALNKKQTTKPKEVQTMNTNEILNTMKILSANMLSLKKQGKDLNTLSIGFFMAMKEQKVEGSISRYMWIESENLADECLAIINKKH